jgi:hypothetical protein
VSAAEPDTTADRSDQWARIPEPETNPVRPSTVPDKPDHAGANDLPEEIAPDRLDPPPTETQGAATAAAEALTADGLFKGQSKAFVGLIKKLASEADAANGINCSTHRASRLCGARR